MSQPEWRVRMARTRSERQRPRGEIGFVCHDCGLERPESEFRTKLTRHVGRRPGPHCKPCERARRVWVQARNNARVRGVSFSLTREHVDRLKRLPCTYCGATAAPANGLDRVDSSLGYVEGNVVPCCTDCNVAKMDRSAHDFIAWITRAADHIRRVS